MISAALIIKNEGEQLAECLEDLAQFADEIVVLDTGSTDNGPAIAKKHKKTKYFVSKRFTTATPTALFQFNVARNEAIDYCTGEWLVSWDADFRLVAGAADTIKALARVKQKVVYQFRIQYGELSYSQARMFPANMGVGYHSDHSCHEFLVTQGLQIAGCAQTLIEHPPRDRGSAERNALILEQDYYARGQRDSRTLFYLANAYRETYHYAKAIDMYGQYLEISQWQEERLFARYYKAQCHLWQGQPLQAQRAALRAIGEDDRFAEPYCLLGDIYCRQRNPRHALLWYEMAARLHLPEDSVLFANAALYGPYPLGRIKALMAPPFKRGPQVHGKAAKTKKPKNKRKKK